VLGGAPQAWSSSSIISTTTPLSYLGYDFGPDIGRSTLSSVLVSELKLILPSCTAEVDFFERDEDFWDLLEENIVYEVGWGGWAVVWCIEKVV